MWILQGFRMTVGNPTTTTPNATKKGGLAYTCLETILTRGFETPDFPKTPVSSGHHGHTGMWYFRLHLLFTIHTAR